MNGMGQTGIGAVPQNVGWQKMPDDMHRRGNGFMGY